MTTATIPASLKTEYLLDPAVVYLNHGSYGACPRPVFDTLQAYQQELERNPVAFLGGRGRTLLTAARAALAAYLGAEADEVVYFPNPTTAINVVARSVALQPGDEILTTDHEYGAMDKTWRFVCKQAGARYIQRPMPLPVTSHADFVDAFWQGVSERTRVIFLSHITSPTALIFPVQEICRRARERGILTVVDGAHAVSQLPLNLAELGADLYTGACHKWLCAPKGSSFLYARRATQAWLQPLVVSWGYDEAKEDHGGYVSIHEWQGTRDISPFLAVPAAIEFQQMHDWDAVRRRCHALASDTLRRIHALTGLEPICPDGPEWFGQMAAARLPDGLDLGKLGEWLYHEKRIVVPLTGYRGQPLIRVSFQAYNTEADADALVAALAEWLAHA